MNSYECQCEGGKWTFYAKKGLLELEICYNCDLCGYKKPVKLMDTGILSDWLDVFSGLS